MSIAIRPLFRFLVLGLLLLASAAPARAQNEVRTSSVSQRVKAHPGDQFAVAVIMDFADKWHAWPNKPVIPEGFEDLTAIPTEVSVAPSPVMPAWLRVHTAFAQFPTPHEAEVTGVKVLAYSDRAVIYIPVELAPDAPLGSLTIPLVIDYQACNDTQCLQPATDPVPVTIEVVAADQPIEQAHSDLFTGFEPAVFARIKAGDLPPDGPAGRASTGGLAGKPAGIQVDFFGATFSVGRVAIFLICFVAGLLMNFTPCVLPVIPIKILSLQSQAKDPGKLLLFGTVYCLGIVALFAAIGGLVFALGLSFGQWFSYWWVTTPLAIFIAVMAFAMMGFFTINLPQSVYALNPSHDTIAGNFGMGVLTGVLSTPCTGPMFGAAFAWAASEPPAIGMSAICTMGVGMAFPYAILMLFPGLLNRMPRGGPGGELLKQVMGLFMLAVAAYLFTNVVVARWPFWIVGGLAGVASLWWLVGAWRMLRSSVGKVLNSLAAVGTLALVAVATPALAGEEPEPGAGGGALGGAAAHGWRVMANQPESAIREAIAHGSKAGKPVVVDFTAKWCSNCLVIEKTILNTDAGRALFERAGAVRLKVDLTKADPDQGWGLVKEISGGGGIPLIAVFGPGLEKPVYFQSFFPLSALEEAMEKAVAK